MWIAKGGTTCGIASDEDLYRVLTLFVAVCESAMIVLERCDPPEDAMVASVVDARDAAAAILTRRLTDASD